MRLTRGRITTVRALEIIAIESRDGEFGNVVNAIRTEIESGGTLSEGLSKAPDYFSLSVCELTRAAEKSGAWDEIMREIAEGIDDGTFD